MGGDFETVYTVTDWYDGPREGIADFNGMPHLYQWQFDNAKDDWADTLLLTPVDEETFRLALEDWAIWVRWEQAFFEGQATQETHPALPEDQARHGELQRLLADRLTIHPAKALRVKAEFRPKQNGRPGKGMKELEVSWTVVEET